MNGVSTTTRYSSTHLKAGLLLQDQEASSTAMNRQKATVGKVWSFKHHFGMVSDVCNDVMTPRHMNKISITACGAESEFACSQNPFDPLG